jgi:hypothetical protein
MLRIFFLISQQPENCENHNDPDLVQAFLKKWWVESDFKAPNLPLSLRFKGSGCHLRNRLLNQGYEKIRLIRSLKKFIFRYQDLVEIYSVSAKKIISDRRQTSRSHYGSKVPAVTITVFKYRNKIGKIVVKAVPYSVN